MRCYLFAITLCGIYAISECLPNPVRDDNKEETYVELVREIAEAVEESERKNDPPYNARSHSNARKSYIEVARNVAEEYIKERRAKDQGELHRFTIYK